MKQRYDGGPAFPRPASEYTKSGTLPDGNDAVGQQDGMTLRDWFAGQALVGLITSEGISGRTVDGKGIGGNIDLDAERCYAMADAMLQHSRAAIEDITTQKETTT